MSNSQTDPSDAPVERDEAAASPYPEATSDIIVAGEADPEEVSIEGEPVATQRRTGRTYEPRKAAEEGLSYTPPRDPATVPSEDDPQGSEVAAGFAPSMEDTDPDARILPEQIDRADLEIQEDVGLALRYNSETAHLTDVSASVRNGEVKLVGTVPSQDDISRVYAIVSELEGVVRVISHLDVAGG